MKKSYLLLFFLSFLSVFVKAQAPANIGVTASSWDICNAGESSSLSCTYVPIFQQTGYTVAPINYAPPYGATAGSATNLTIDDRWSGVIDLKGLTPQDFNFCFYNNNYLKCLISTNGVMTFSVAGEVAGGVYSPGSFSTWVNSGAIPLEPTMPAGTAAPFRSSINGVFQDINPYVNNSFATPNINYYTIGNYPNRAFVVNFANVAQYGCSSDATVGAQTSQLVLYEATNIIDVYVQRRYPCVSWSNGNGLIGVQNESRTVATAAPGRNGGTWTATNEAWRFTPNGILVAPTFQWTDNLGNVVGNTQNLTVTPNATTTYTVTATYPSCNPAVTYQVTDQTTVNIINIPAGAPSPLYNCDTGAASYSWDFTPNSTAIMSGLNPASYVLSYHTSQTSAEGGDNNVITGSTTNYTAAGGTTIWSVVEDLYTGCRKVQSFNLIVRICTTTPVQPSNLVACDADGNGTEAFDLSQQNITILGGQNAADYNITYHTTLASADGTSLNSALIPPGTAAGQVQNFVSAGQTIYVRMERVSNPAAFGNTSFQLIVNPRPVIGGTLSACAGATTQLTGSGTPAVSNAWTSANTAVATVDASGLVTAVAAGTSVITYTDGNGCSNTTTVTVNPIPTVTVNSGATCQGGTVSLTATPGTPGTYNYAWTVPTGAANPGNVASFAASVAGAYGVVITDTATNCSSAIGAGSVTVNPLPTVTVNSPVVCSGNAATVTATPGDSSVYSYVWTVPAGFANPGNVPSFTTTVAGTYSVVITNTATTCSSASASGTVTVNALPTVVVNSPVICAGSTATVTATPGTAGTYSYAWTVPAGVTNPGNVASFAATVAGTYSVVITDTTTTCSSASASGTVTVNPLPTVTVNNSDICPGETATVTAAPGTAGTYTYVWTVPGGVTNPGNVASFTTATGGTYSVVITDTATNCSSASSSGTVTVKPLGGSMNLQCGPYNSAGHPGEIYIDWSNVPGITTFNYSYSINGGPVVTGSQNSPSSIYILTNGQTITFTLSGVGSVCVPTQTITCGCPSPIIDPVANVSACSGQTVNQIDFTTSYTYDSVSWTNSNPAIGLAASGTGNFIPAFTAASVTTPQTATITVVLTDGGCTGPARTFTITVNPLPTVTVNSPVTCAGTNTTVTATPGVAGGYSYAWTVPAGVTNPGNIASFPTSVAGTYSVVITNTATGCVSASASGTVTVNALPTVTVNSETVCAGSAATLTATPGTAGTYSYAWTVPTGATNPGNVASFSTTVAGTYSVIITDLATNCSSASASGSLNNNPLPTVTVNNPSICAGDSVTVAATTGSVASYSYAWTVPGGVANPGNVASFVTSTPGAYTVVVTNVTTGCVSAAVTGNVTLNPTPTVVASPDAQTLCSGQSTGIQLTGTVPNTTFSWTYTQTGGVTGASNGSGNIISQVLTVGATSGTVTYTITPTSAGSCIGTPATVTVTVNPVPVVNVNTTAQSICTGGTTNITMSSNVATATFNWNVVQSGGVTGGTSGTGTSITDVLTASGTTIGQAIYTITPISNGCPGIPKTVTVTVYPNPNVTASPASQTLCSGDTTNIVLTSNVPGTVFNWTVVQTGLFGAASGTGNTISQTLTTVGLTSGTVTYTITPTVNGCIGNPITVTVTVNPKPELFSSSLPQVICSGQSSGITVTPNIPGTSIIWTVVQNGVTGGFDGNGSETTPGAGIAINQVLTATGTAQGTATYTITPINNGCSGTPITVVIKVNPLPKTNIADGVICVDAATGALIYGYMMNTGLNAAEYDFQWYFNGDMNNVIATESSYMATEAGQYTVFIMNSVTGCSDVFIIDVTASNPATTATAVVTNYFEDSQVITVTVAGNGSYLYSLDGGEFQTSNVFPHVLPGLHTVTIQDAIGCTNITLTNILTIGYPNFFTPNGDGFNDTWNIWSLSEDQPNSEIHIFDRYGKLIKQLVPSGEGWDGTFNGQVMPSTDYWFTVKYKENGAEKLFKAHFSMKR